MDFYAHSGARYRSFDFAGRTSTKSILMDFRLQFGYGMMEHCRSLVAGWAGGTVILSPRDLTESQMVRLSKDLRKINGQVSVDPQFYLPHSDHYRLSNQEYWPKQYDSSVFWQGPALAELIQKLQRLNKAVGSRETILPGLLAAEISDDWIAIQDAIVEEATATQQETDLITTIALGAESLRSPENVGALLEAAERWDTAGYYVVAEHPRGQYLVDDANWLANILDLVAGLKLYRRKVIVGYSNHQMLALAITKVDAICSGTWMNVRSFPPEKFSAPYEDEMKQRATWYYCPQALSEYKIPFLDVAYRQGVLQDMAPDNDQDGGFVTALFAGAQPSSVGFSEQAAFRHYLHALRAQCQKGSAASFDEALRQQMALLDRSEGLLRRLSVAGVHGQLRDFTEIVDVNRAAITLFESTRGPMMRRLWNSL